MIAEADKKAQDLIDNAKNPIAPALSFNSRRFPSGVHKLKIHVTNKEGKESMFTHYVYLHNKVSKKTQAKN